MGEKTYRITTIQALPDRVTADFVKDVDTLVLAERLRIPGSGLEEVVIKAELKRREDEVIERRHQAELTLASEAVEESRKANRIAADAASSAWHSRWVAVAALVVAILV